MGDIKKGFWNTWLGKKLSSFGSWISDKTSSFWSRVKNWWNGGNGDNNANVRKTDASNNLSKSQDTGQGAAQPEVIERAKDDDALSLIVEHIYNQIKPIVEPQKCDKDFVINELRKTVSNYYSLNKIPIPVVKNTEDCKKFNISKNRISLPVARLHDVKEVLHDVKEVMSIPIHIPTIRKQEVENPTIRTAPTVDTVPNEKPQPTASTAVGNDATGSTPNPNLNSPASTPSSSRRNVENPTIRTAPTVDTVPNEKPQPTASTAVGNDATGSTPNPNLNSPASTPSSSRRNNDFDFYN